MLLYVLQWSSSGRLSFNSPEKEVHIKTLSMVFVDMHQVAPLPAISDTGWRPTMETHKALFVNLQKALL